MNGNNKLVTRTTIKGNAIGLFLMAFFTIGWAGMAEGSLNGKDHGSVVIIFSLISYGFIGYAIYLLRISKRFSSFDDEVQKSASQKLMKQFYMNFGVEIIAVCILSFILNYLHKNDYIVPVIALIIGLHFYPLTKIFKRKIDYFFATWTCIISICGILMLLFKSFSVSNICSFVSIGVAFATTGYGIYMLYKGEKYKSMGINENNASH